MYCMIIRTKNMGCFNLLLFFIYLFSLSSLLIIQNTAAQAQPVYVYHFCLGSNYTTNSAFQKNLNILLPSLSSPNNSRIRNGYYNSTAGRNPDTVYGSLQCRGDISSEDCQTCAETAAKDIITDERCPTSKQAIIWYEMCMIRYSNQYYFNLMQDSPRVYLLNVNNVTDPVKFNPILADLLNDLVKKAITNGSSNFATADTSFNDFQKVYGLVQCTTDILPRRCNECLVGAISELPNCCYGKQGGRVIRPSCNLRYELYPFAQSAPTPSPPPLSPFPSPPVLQPSSTNTSTTTPNAKGNSSILAISIVIPSVIAALATIAFWFFCFRRKRTKTQKLVNVDDEMQSTELQFNFSTISGATDNFSEANKLGEGGFGSVYKGTLSDGQEIAVKRLSKNSGQGAQEFKNEVTLVAKLQHRNLVRLLGFCIDGEEKLLVYEFMPNGSLDQFLFDPDKCAHLDWERRYKIIGGIARGLLYLHEESRLKIIHRDLKASNILLDTDMNPKIGDFGMARLFVVDQTQANTNRVVGTYGYMAPEYAMHGQFSVKSDVFSFGVLVIEILSGQKNNCFQESDVSQDLLSYAWRHWKNGSPVELLDSTLKDTCSRSEAMRCIHIGLLCVQENVADRPTMPTVLLMLNSHSVSLDLPSAPAFFAGSTRCIEPKSSPYLGQSEEQGIPQDKSPDESAAWSINETSISELYPR
ncbi:putative receptor-like protein kinase At4g00960 [Papaver somniferum]|uniref:putative receptor-like protein kinase At4g00960 n=1 Tax=Papaver somniferum TaxID=3469 RepID=UPI000E6FF7F7|nr:putative receptor-like protein kinase At4g00960 [Papaver somniferum]